MKPRSLVFNVYGDYVRYRGGETSLRSLTELLSCFGISEDATRVTLSRMSREGWLAARRIGRRSYYSLTERSWRLLDEGRPRIFHRRAWSNGSWDGRWCLLLYSIPEAERSLRDRLRKALAWMGFGALAPSTWISPHDRAQDLQDLLMEQGLNGRYHIFFAHSQRRDEDRLLASKCWDLSALGQRYAAFLETYTPRLQRYISDPDMTDEERFVERIRLVHDYRKFPFIDPDLPEELLPSEWTGRRAHEVFLQAYEALREGAFRFFDRHFEPRPLA